jgi:membrane peptidoglycan carboxypeptidase
VAAAGATMAVVGMQTLNAYANDLANPSTIINYKNTGTTLLDRNGKVLYKVYGAPDRTLVTFDEVPKVLRDATLAAEDPKFYQHPGFSWQATARALITDISDRSKTEGGSTITQQLVKSSLLTPQKSYSRKYKEILLAMAVEKKYNKDQV